MISRMPRRQRGLALVVMAVMVVLGATYVVIAQLDPVGRRLDQDRASLVALKDAKEALVGYAVNATETFMSQQIPHPGGLPCPDTDNDGVAEAACTTPNSRIGRLPWKTLGASDLRDARGERLWYALSANFRNASGVVINSDTAGTLTVKNGSVDQATNAVAVLFAPGNAIQGQSRSTSEQNLVQMYLEGRNNYAMDASATNDDIFDTADSSDVFNDKLAVLTIADLMGPVEASVASRLQSLAKYYIYNPTNPASSTTYYGRWGVFPYPATFANPATSLYLGDSSRTEGLLPITATQSNVQWGTPSISKIAGTGSITSTSCTFSAMSVSCTINYQSGRPVVQVSVTAPNVGMTFAQPLVASDITVAACGGSMSNTTFSPATPALNASPAGSYTVVYSGRTPNPCVFGTWGNLTITIPFPAMSALTSSTDPIARWFIVNQWYKQTYYAVSPGYVVGGGNTCGPSPLPACLTVNNLSGTTDNKRVLLILAGRSINGTARPDATGTLANYLENQNNSVMDRIFETNRQSATFNDRVIVVAP